MRSKTLAAVALAVVVAAIAFLGSASARPGKTQATFKAALVSDVGRFNDKGLDRKSVV